MTDHKEFRVSGEGPGIIRVAMGAETLGVSGSSVEALQNFNSWDGHTSVYLHKWMSFSKERVEKRREEKRI